MQTLTELARMIVKWERLPLPKGAYRLSGIETLANAPDAAGFSDCTYDAQFVDELICVKASLGLAAGVWVGLILDHGQFAEVLALLMD